MINLLPPIDKEELQKGETFRLVLVLGVLSILFFISLSLLLITIRVYVAGEIEVQKILVETAKAEQEESVLQKIRGLNGDIVATDTFYRDQIVLSDIISRITAAVPAGMYFNSFSYALSSPQQKSGQQQTEGANAKVSITGFAPTTEDLLTMRSSLEEDEAFKNFNFPASNWVRPEEIDFSFMFEIQSPK